MDVGGVEQIGTPEEIYNRPRTRFVADFVGSANLIEGRMRDSAHGPGRITFEAKGGAIIKASAWHRPKGSETTVAIRTAYIDLALSAPTRNGINTMQGMVHRRMFHGDFVQYIVDCPVGELIVRRPPTEIFAEGVGVALSFAAEHCTLLEE